MNEVDTSRPRIVLTGPSGWIGTAMLAHIAERFGPGWSKSVTLFGSSTRSHRAVDGSDLDILALEDILAQHVDGAIVIHLAYLTKEKVDLAGEQAFTDANLAIDDAVLDALTTGRPRSVFVASSGAAAMAEKGYGREPYGLCKLQQEKRFLSWSAKTGVPVLAGRIFNLAGPYINKVASYAIGSFATQARRDGQIRIDARIPVFRSFLHVDDLCALIFGAGLAEIGRSFPIDLCGAEALEMGDIAQAVAEHIGGNVTIVRGIVNGENPSIYLGNFVDTKVLAMEVGIPLTPFNKQLADTVTWLGTA